MEIKRSKTTKLVNKKTEYKKTINRVLISFALIINSILMTILVLEKTSAIDENKLNSSICETNKCFARVERLEQCFGEIDVVKCAVNKTLEASRNTINLELEELYKLSSVKITSNTFKELTIKLIKKHEGLALEAYCDTLSPFTRRDGTRGLYKNCNDETDRWSVGYGTISKKGEVITTKEAEKRMLTELENNFFPYLESASACNYNEYQKASIADFYYNAGVWAGLKPYVDSCDNASVIYMMNPDAYAGGLKDRRNSQREYFLSGE